MKKLLFIFLVLPLFSFGQDCVCRFIQSPYLRTIQPHSPNFGYVFVNRANGILYANDTLPDGGGASDSTFQFLTADTLSGNSLPVVLTTGIRIPYLANTHTKVMTIDSVGLVDTAATSALSDYFENNVIKRIRVDSISDLTTINSIDTGNFLYVDPSTNAVVGKTSTLVDNYLFRSITIGDTSSGKAYIKIDSTNGLRMYNGATSWEDLRVSPTELKSVGVVDKPDFNFVTLTLDFPQGDSSEAAGYVYQLPHSWREGTSVEFHLHVEHDTTGTPVFALQYQWVNTNAVIPATWTRITSTGFVYTRTSGQKIHNMIEFPAISGVGKTISSIFKVKIYRIDNSYIGDCRILEADLHIEIDAFGSKTETSK